MNLGKEETDELEKLKTDTDKITDKLTIQDICLIQIAEALIVIKNKIGRKWL